MGLGPSVLFPCECDRRPASRSEPGILAFGIMEGRGRFFPAYAGVDLRPRLRGRGYAIFARAHGAGSGQVQLVRAYEFCIPCAYGDGPVSWYLSNFSPHRWGEIAHVFRISRPIFVGGYRRLGRTSPTFSFRTRRPTGPGSEPRKQSLAVDVLRRVQLRGSAVAFDLPGSGPGCMSISNCLGGSFMRRLGWRACRSVASIAVRQTGAADSRCRVRPA